MQIQELVEKYFAGRKLLFATMHGKERIVRPLLEQRLGVDVVAPVGLNTDLFGTFSGEVERALPPLETARQKCEEAARLAGETLVLSSEGSFGAHPVLGFVPANEELLLLKDFQNGWEFKARVLSMDTNFNALECNDLDRAISFLDKIGFPSHAVILRKSKADATEIHKGIQDWKRFKESFHYFIGRYGTALIETDMRAHLNPTRQVVIRKACEKLITVISNFCPVCATPGFAVGEVISGLPCSQCETPTRSAKAYLYTCHHCGHTVEKSVPERKKKEDPMYCDVCNP